MTRDTLLDFFEDTFVHDDPFIVHDDRDRVRQVTYRGLAKAARAFAARLRAEGVAPDATVVIWSENRIEWVIAQWGAVLARVVLVPVDYRASADAVRRISRIVGAKAVLVGAAVTPSDDLAAPVWRLTEVASPEAGLPDAPARTGAEGVTGATVAQIVFTSGATADPKGVRLTHRNILANLIPIEQEARKYRRYLRPFHPVRFLNLLPQSHMFGQLMTTIVPPMVRGTVIFAHGYSPAEMLRQIRSRRVSVLVCVPKVLDVLRAHLVRILPDTAGPDPLAGRHWIRRVWHYRRVHRLFGWKFCAIVCGAAPLSPDIEAFWRKLGYLVIQGYGLTETAPVVTLNHPLRATVGTVGMPLAGVEIRIADDGEILVRGDNVTTGYVTESGTATPALSDGWFHTGDIGGIDAEGRLRIKGRKRDMIVTAQGLNVFPDDVERVLVTQPGVRDAGVVGHTVDGDERVHAVLALEPGVDAHGVVRDANATLADHQRIWSSSVWPGETLPRTDGTHKLKRREIQRWVAGMAPDAPAVTGAASVESVVARFASGRDLGPETTLDELGLSSLDCVALLIALEEAFQTTLDEVMIAEAHTLADLRCLVAADAGPDGAGPQAPRHGAPIVFPSWTRSRTSRLLRRLSLPTWILPTTRLFMNLRVEGLEHLASIDGPVVFAANHQSHMDTPAIFSALPPRWRYRVAVAIRKEFFHAHFHRRHADWKARVNSLGYVLACQFLNGFPLPQREAGTRGALRYMGDLAADGYSILIYPEGQRTERGEIIEFRPGVGLIAARLGVPVVPIRLEGLDHVLHRDRRFPRRGRVRVAFGAPMRLVGEDYAALAAQVEVAVRSLDSC